MKKILIALINAVTAPIWISIMLIGGVIMCIIYRDFREEMIKNMGDEVMLWSLIKELFK